ncbi:AAA family ATPase [Nocardia sp. NPDC048505]|uniref:helix-turn-helix transcriptional regulator n=1 Tax=unclassified Nocardia TaxID=2637762 RepID=UPI0033E1B6C7
MTGERGFLLGRDDQLAEIAGLLSIVRNSQGRALRLLGDPGIGKTALLEAAVTRAAGFRILRSDGFEVEQALPYAGLQRLLARLEPDSAVLPAQERQGLEVAVGRSRGPVPDRFLVGRALLGLLAYVAREVPVLCVVDDVQWMDRESLDALGFAARRLHAEAVLVLFAARPDPDVDVHLGGVPVVELAELDRADAIALLTTRLGVTSDPLVAAGIVDAVGGNPLALTDLGEDLGVRRLADSSFIPSPLGSGRQLEQLYQRQARSLPVPAQQWLLVAAAESTGDLRLVDEAAALLGVDESAGETADSAGLVIIGGTVRFRHPLIQTAVYSAVPAADRRRVHAALAVAARARDLDDLAAWHAAEAAARPDDGVADRLAAAAYRAARRGGLISQASLLTKAAELTVDPDRRQERLIDAAEAAAAAGAGRFALELLERGGGADGDPIRTGRRLALRASLAVFLLDAAAIPEAAAHLVAAAELFRDRDPDRERQALLHAFDLALPVESRLRGTTFAEIGTRMRRAAGTSGDVVATVLTGVAALILDPYAEAVAPIRAAVEAIAALGDDPRILLFGPAGVALTTALWDERARDRHLDQSERVAVAGGALKALDTYLWMRSVCDVDRSDPLAASRTIERVRETRRAMGYPAEHVRNGAYLAWSGQAPELVEQVASAGLAAGYGAVHSTTLHALAVRDLARGAPEAALAKLTDVLRHAVPQALLRYLPEHVEAAVRCGHRADAARGAATLAEVAAASGSPWARGVSARCQALLDETPAAEQHFRTALELLATTNAPGDLDRTHLLYGEWLRRNRRRKDAGIHLRRASAGFEQAGITAFVERAHRELAALGESAALGAPASAPRLTVQEAQVARLAAAGATNPEIASTLFLSPNTVDYHLRKVFRKLNISSRRQLREHRAVLERT